MPLRPDLTPLVAGLPDTIPFVGPETQERRRGSVFKARIGANESGFGPSPRVVGAMAEAAGEMWKYCDPENHDLKQAIAERHGLSSRNIVIGEGIDGLLGLTVRQYVSAGTPVVTSLGAYPTFNYHVAGFGGRLVTVPYVDDREDIGSLLEAVKREHAPLIYLSNPDNPMGTWWEASDLVDFINDLPETTMLVLDEAYCETAPESALPVFDVSRRNVLRMRTFSKAYGLAGLRCGYAIGEEGAIAAFDRVRNHFGVNRMAQAACLAALEDGDYLKTVVQRVAECRTRIKEIAWSCNLQTLPSATNFVTIDCGGDGKHAADIMNKLLEAGIFVRKPMVPVLDRCIRVSCGPENEIAVFEETLQSILGR